MKILIATDGSEFSREAVEKTCQTIVTPEDTEIKIVCVYPPVLPLDAFPQSVEYAEALEKKERADAENYVESAAALVKEYFPDSPVKVETEIKTGAPDQVILETAKAWKANVIVVGSHGRGFWGRLTLGSVSDSIIHHAPCSVFVVRKTGE
ncbi:MAG TPA: universal stress protein [Pyrinomonadaceae bacterium]|nr:universal stress protein [Pyrinomonadaceae bacterium]